MHSRYTPLFLERPRSLFLSSAQLGPRLQEVQPLCLMSEYHGGSHECRGEAIELYVRELGLSQRVVSAGLLQKARGTSFGDFSNPIELSVHYEVISTGLPVFSSGSYLELLCSQMLTRTY